MSRAVRWPAQGPPGAIGLAVGGAATAAPPGRGKRTRTRPRRGQRFPRGCRPPRAPNPWRSVPTAGRRPPGGVEAGGSSPLPQPRGALVAVLVPVLVTGRAPATAVNPHGLSTRLARAWGTRAEWPFPTGPTPVLGASR